MFPFCVVEQLRPKRATFGTKGGVQDEGNAVTIAAVVGATAPEQLATAGRAPLHLAAKIVQLTFFCTTTIAGCALSVVLFSHGCTSSHRRPVAAERLELLERVPLLKKCLEIVALGA